MKSILIKIIFMLALIAITCGLTIVRGNQTVRSSQQKFINSPCRIIINFDKNIVPNDNQIIAIDSIKSKDLQTALCSPDERMDIEAVYSNRYMNGKLKPEFMHSDDGNWYMIVSNNHDKATKLITSLQHFNGIKEIYLEEPVLIKPYGVEQASFPYSSQWHLTKASGIDAEEAWTINKGRSDVIIAVCDGGVDYTHPNLDPGNRSRVIAGYDYGDNDNDPMDNLPYNDPQSYAGHGTHISGIIGAFPTTTNQISGVMQNCKIMPVKMVGGGSLKIIFTNISLWDFSSTAFPSDVANAIDYAVNNGAKVINLSYGFSVPNLLSIEDIFYKTSLLAYTIRNAYYKNVVIVAAMGNEYEKGNPVEYPAAFYPVIAVGATTQSKTKASFSSTGSHICISAPGDNILSTTRGGSTGYKSGTSMAAPIVSGVAGLIISQGLDRNMNLTNDDVRHIMEVTADKVGGADFTKETGYGIVNAYSALKLLDTPKQLFHEEAYGGTSSIFDSNFTWILYSNFGDLPAGVYLGVDQYEVISHITFKNPFMDIPKVWIRERECSILSFANPNNGLPKVSITNITSTGCDIRYSVYYVRYTEAGQTLNKWIPAQISSAKVAYTTVGTPRPTITGPKNICVGSSYTFSVINAPSGFTWGVSSNLTKSGSGSSITVTGSYGSGGGWVSVLYNGTELARDSIWVGGPVISSIVQPSSTPPNQTLRFKAIYNYLANVNATNPSNWEWQVPGNGGFMYNWGENADISFTPGTYQVVVRASNTCGWGPYCVINVNASSTGSYSIAYPNPAVDVLNVEIGNNTVSPESAQAAVAPLTTGIDAAAVPLIVTDGNQSKSADPAYDIRLYNGYGSQLFQATAKKGGKVQFNVSILPNGTYYLHIYDGINPQPEKQQIIVKH